MPDVKNRFLLSWKEWIVVAAIIVVLVALLLPAVQQGGGGSAMRDECKQHLKRIAIALHRYHDEHNCFPPAYVADENGRPMHSWRVLILPYLDRQQLYDRYHFDEPWDGPNNSKLADEALDVFNCPSAVRKNGKITSPMTNYVAVVGQETAWPGKTSTKLEDITDGTASTLLVVEVINSGIRWMEPRDLQFSEMAPAINSKSTSGISSVHNGGGAFSVFVDGHVWFLNERLPAGTVKALLTHAGGEAFGEF